MTHYRMIKRIHLVLICALDIILSGCQLKPTELVVATYAYSSNDRVNNLTPLKDLLAQSLNQPFVVKSYRNVPELLSAIREDKVDIAFINTLGYLKLDDAPHPMSAMAVLNIDPGYSNNYKSVILSSKASGVSNMEQLLQKMEELDMMFVAKQSTSGFLVPKQHLSNLGRDQLKKHFRNLTYGRNHQATFDHLINGNTDICAIGSNEYFSRITRDPNLANSINLLWLSEEIPLGPVLVNNNLSSALQSEIQSILLNLNNTDVKVLDAIKGGWSEAKNSTGFVRIDDDHYADLRKSNSTP